MNRVYKWYLRMHNSNYAFIRRSISNVTYNFQL